MSDTPTLPPRRCTLAPVSVSAGRVIAADAKPGCSANVGALRRGSGHKARGQPKRSQTPIWTPERLAALRQCHADGLTRAEAAQRLGVSVDGVRWQSRQLGLTGWRVVQGVCPTRREWTPAQDAHILRRRAERATWTVIAGELGLPYNAVYERGQRLRMRPEAARPPVAPLSPSQAAYRPDGAPLPAGSALTWGLITRGTLLEGVPYGAGVPEMDDKT